MYPPRGSLRLAAAIRGCCVRIEHSRGHRADLADAEALSFFQNRVMTGGSVQQYLQTAQRNRS